MPTKYLGAISATMLEKLNAAAKVEKIKASAEFRGIKFLAGRAEIEPLLNKHGGALPLSVLDEALKAVRPALSVTERLIIKNTLFRVGAIAN